MELYETNKESTSFSRDRGLVQACTPEMANDITKIIVAGPAIADGIYSEQNWQRTLSRSTRTMLITGFFVVNDDGKPEMSSVEVALVSALNDVTYFCRGIFNRQRIANKCGCTFGRSPHRIVAIDPESAKRMNGACGGADETLHHELWHLKGFYDHGQLKNGGTWPSNKTKPAPRRRLEKTKLSMDFR